MRSLAVVALAALVAGCGSAASKSGDPPGGAAVAPSSTAVLVQLDTSFTSPQWQALRALAGLVPGGAALLHQADAAKQALGPETDVAVLGGAGPRTVVGLTEPARPADLDALLARQHPPLVSEPIGSWRAIARDRGAIDRFKQARNGGTLLGSQTYRQAIQALPSSPLASVYVDGTALSAALGTRAAAFGATVGSGLGRAGWLAGALTAREHGVSLELRLEDEAVQATPFTPTLPAEVPAGAVLYVGFAHLDAALGRLSRLPALSGAAGALQALGPVVGDAVALFEGEGAFYVRPGSPAEETLVLKVADEQAARRTLERLVALGGALGQARQVTVGGVEATRLTLGTRTLYAAVFAGKLVVTTVQAGIAALQSGPRLADSQAWQEATAAGGLPAQVSGLVYADVPRLLPLVGGAVGIPARTRRDLGSLRTGLLYATTAGKVLTLEGFVSVR